MPKKRNEDIPDGHTGKNSGTELTTGSETQRSAPEEGVMKESSAVRDNPEFSLSYLLERKVFHIIMEEMSDAVLILCRDGRIRFCNRGFAEYFSTSVGALVGQFIFDFLVESEKNRLSDLLIKSATERVTSDILFSKGNGADTFLLNLVFRPIVCEDTNSVCVLASATSQLKRSHEELSSSKSDLEIKINERTEELENINTELRNSRLAALNMMADAVEAKNDLEKLNLELVKEIKERAAAEELLKRSEERFRNIFTNSLAVMFLIDPETRRLVDVNHSAEQFYGWTREQLLDMRIDEINILPSDKIGVELSKAISNDRVQFEFKHRLADGSIRDVNAYVSRVEISGKYFLHTIIIDITERKKAEKINNIQFNIAKAVIASKSTMELFEAIHRELSSAMEADNFYVALYRQKTGMLRAVLDTNDDDISEWPAKNSLSGYVIEKKMPALLKKQDIQNLIDEGRIELIGKPTETWLGVPLLTEDRILGVIALQSYENPAAYDQTSIDILEVVAHELSIHFEKIEAEEEALRLLKAIEQSPISVVITDVKGTIEYVNPHFCSVSGYAADEVIGKNPKILKSGDMKREEYRKLWETISSGKEWKGEFLNRKKNGELFWEESVVAPLINQKGEITNYFAIKEDVTDKKKMVEELISSKEKAEEMSRLKSHFLANMSHELRTPLIGILGFSEIMIEEAVKPEIKQMAQTINKSGSRLLDTLNLILDLSRVEAGRLEIKKENVNVNQVITGSVILFSETAAHKGLYLNHNIPDENVFIRADSKILEQILNNLVNNAVKFTKKGGVTITLHKLDDRISVSVADTGIGISENDQKIIWEEFRQASEGYSRSFEGTGLGLTITKKFIEKLGGTISVKSEVNKGSEFIFEIPLLSSPSGTDVLAVKSDTPPEVKTLSAPPPVKKKILLVEDDPVAVDLMNAMLGRSFEIEYVNNGSDGIKKAMNRNYDLVLMDINLGKGMNGIEVTRKLREIPRYHKVPIIAVTAFAMVGDREEFLSAGCTQYLSKPFTRKELLNVIQEALSAAQNA
ncbi:MAG: PAS domain S-box protein [Ignavibacteriaceae bacterium]|nr:PAS domain S-box protein [Ignavibacteriaceae bacterium]